MSYFGLYFGNTNMCLAMHKDSKTEVLANAAGYRVTPAVIAFLDGSERVVGLDAKQAMQRNLGNTVTHIKNLLESANEEEEIKSQKITNGKKPTKNDSDVDSIVSKYGISDFLTILFKNMKEIATSHSHEDDCPTVVTVPLSFTQYHRQVVRQAVTEAGFQLLRIVTEPAAAALAYNIGQESNDSNSKCLVFRMGGKSIDVTVLQVSYGMYSVLSTAQRKNFGGNLLTSCIVDFCSSEFQRQYKVDVKENKRSVMKLRTAAEHYKQVVYGTTNERCQVESLYDGIDLNINISKARFDSLIHSTVMQCLEPVNEALLSASLSTSDINSVILCGGTCKLPKVQQLFGTTFPSASILFSISPDEVVAVGAAKQAILLDEESMDEDQCYINLLTQDLSIKVSGVGDFPSELLLCSKGTVIPSVITQSFTVKNSDTSLCFEIFEGSSDEKKVLLATLRMPNLPIGEVYFSFQIRSDGSITVTCKDGHSKELGSASVVPPHLQKCS